MADDVTFQAVLLATPPDATTVAADDVGGVKYQRVKLDGGGDGLSVPIIAGQQARAASLPVALSTQDAALLADLLTNTNFQARIPTNGQKAMAASLPVVLASDQSAIPVTLTSTAVTGNVEVTNDVGNPLPVNGTVTANLGTIGTAATAAKQDTGNTSVASIDTKTPALGQAVAGSSVPVVLPSAQITTLTPPAAITGFATEATLAIMATEATLAGQSTRIGALAETAPATDTASSGLNGRLQRIAQRITSLIALIPAALGQGTMAQSFRVVLPSDQSSIPVANTAAATEAHLGEVGGNPATADVTLTRPADTTTYAANDEMTDTGGAILTFSNAARTSGGGGFITDLVVSSSANVAVKPQLVLFLYDTTSTPASDNAAFAPTDTVQNTCVAVIPINIWYPGDDTAGATGNAIGVYGGPPIGFKTSGSANLFGRVKVLNAYVPPANSETFKFRLKVRRD